MNYPETDEFIKKLNKLSKQDFKNSLYPSSKSISEEEQFIKHGINDRIKFLQDPFYRQNYHIIFNFLSDLINDDLYNIINDSNFEQTYDTSLKLSNRVVHADFCTKLESFGNDIDTKWLCLSYQVIFEQACKSFFKPYASKIRKKDITSCTQAFSIISKYDEYMKNILKPFNSHIRNSITHSDWYYDEKEKLLIFDDQDKPRVSVSTVTLSEYCKDMLINEDCFFSADFTIMQPIVEENIINSKAILKLLDFCDVDSDEMLKKLFSYGHPLKFIRESLEQHIRNVISEDRLG